jgi:hypothetical protein
LQRYSDLRSFRGYIQPHDVRILNRKEGCIASPEVRELCCSDYEDVGEERTVFHALFFMNSNSFS